MRVGRFGFAFGSCLVAMILLGSSDGLAAGVANPMNPDDGGALGWSEPSLLTPSPSSADWWPPQVAVDLRGNAIAVWQEGEQILARRFVLGIGWIGDWYDPDWGPSIQWVGNGTSPRLAMNPAGSAFVVWEAAGNILARRWAPGYGWFATDIVGGGNLSSGGWVGFGHVVVMDSDGDLVVVWTDQVLGYWVLHARRFGAGWGLVESIGSSLTVPGGDIAIDPGGNSTVIWEQDDGRSTSILAERFVRGVGWGEPQEIDAGPGNASSPRLAMDAAGNAVAIWAQVDNEAPGQVPALYARRFVAGEGWEQLFDVSDQVDCPCSPHNAQIAMAPDGSAVVLWGWNHVRQFRPGLGWQATETIPWDVSAHGIQIDARGSILVSGHPSGLNTPGLVAKYYTREDGWGQVEVLDARGDGYGPQPAVDGMGNAMLVWETWTSLQVYASRFVRSTVPELRLVSPSESLTNRPVVTISGLTYPAATVTVNGTAVPVDLNGAFGITVDLPDGIHSFEVMATGPEGGVSRRVIVITVDTTAPQLSLHEPADGVTVDTSTVTLAGTTEPDARVVANGLLVGVAPNGSFSIVLALQPGLNDIVVTATDLAGNTAFVSLEVTYFATSPTTGPSSGLDILAVSSGVSVVAASALAILVWSLWARRDRKGSEEDPGAANDPAPQQVHALGPGHRLARVAARHAPQTARDKLWPLGRPGSPLRLTAKERVLLHLLDFARFTDAADVPPDLTQVGIARPAGVDLRHFAQYLRPLVKEGLVRERNAHVKGAVNRHKVYVLTDTGRSVASGLRDRVRSVVIRVRDASGTHDATVGDALARRRGSRVLEIVRESIETGVVDISRG